MTDKPPLPPLPTTPERGTWWDHRKGGVYEIVCIARLEATCEPVVVYRSPCGFAWVRPHAEFVDGRFTPTTNSHYRNDIIRKVDRT